MITRSTPPSGLYMTRFMRIAKRWCDRANLTVISRDNVGEIYLLFSIILTMISPRSTVTKLLAACLLICSVWMFAACVLLCSAHHESANASEALLSVECVNRATIITHAHRRRCADTVRFGHYYDGRMDLRIGPSINTPSHL